MREWFQNHVDEEHCKFDRVQGKKSGRGDLHAFMLLDRLLPGRQDIIGCAEHDQVWLSVDADDLAKVCTEDDVIELLRCGVTYDEDTQSLHMFV